MAASAFLLLVLSAHTVSAGCGLTPMSIVFRDIHDGDYKLATIASDTSLTIKPFNNTESWVINTGPFSADCTVLVDFNVPGKPNPPPVKLLLETANIQYMNDKKSVSAAAIFTDPSGTLADPKLPLNIWYGLGTVGPASKLGGVEGAAEGLAWGAA